MAENMQKIKLIKLYELLLRETDSEHAISRTVLCQRLNDMGISSNVRTLSKDIDVLNSNGYEIMSYLKDREKFYYVPEHALTIPEIKTLIDAVQAASFITEKKTAELVEKIAALGGSHQAKLMKGNMVRFNTRKHTNESILYIIDSIEEAITKRKKITFNYFHLNENAERVYVTTDGGETKIYDVEPVALIFNEDNYYLMAYSERHPGTTASYRIDRMDHVEVIKGSKMSAEARAKELTSEGIPTPAGKSQWRASTISSILRNEKYRGSALLQKCFTTDFLTKKQKVNEGEVPQYYIEHSHEAIIDPLEWDAVQEEIKRRKQIGRAYSGHSVFSAKLICGDCGGWYGHKIWHSTDKYRSSIWQCNRKYAAEKCNCKTPSLTDEEIQTRFLRAFNSIISSKKPYLSACLTAKEVLTDTTQIDAQISALQHEIDIISELTRKCIEGNSAIAQDQKEFTERYNGYVDRYELLKARRDELITESKQKDEKAKAIDRFIQIVKSRRDLLTEFDPHLWLTTVESVTVSTDGKMLFHFFDGTEVTG